MLCVITLWGLSFVVIKLTLTSIPPLLLSALRFTLTCLPWIFFMPLPKELWKSTAILGLLLGVGKFSLLLIALNGLIGAGMASLILQSQVFFSIAFSYFFLKEPINRYQFFGISLAITGLVMICVTEQQDSTLTGIFMILIAGLLWSISNTLIKTLHIDNMLTVMVWAFALAPIPLFLLSFMFESQQPLKLLTNIELAEWLSIAFLAYGSTLLAYALWYRLLRKYNAAKVTPFALLIPVIGLFSSHVIMAESFAVMTLIAVALIMTGLMMCVTNVNPLTHILSPSKKRYGEQHE